MLAMTHWKTILKSNFHRTETLLDFLSITNRQEILKKSAFCLNVPRRLAEKMEKNNTKDPLFLQFVPLKKELDQSGMTDPVKDHCFQKTPRLLQKYRGRALLVTNGACAMHCRFCFRQNYDYTYKNFEEEIALIEKDTSLHEVILSGGDPLSLPDEALQSLLEKLGAIPHIQMIRFHTRFPIGIPERISPEFLDLLKRVPKQIFFMLHVNHARELDNDILTAMKAIQHLSIPVLSQTVLLRGVNDSVQALKELYLKLVKYGILPYYLHALDPVQGALHFDVLLEEGKALIEALRKELPGYAVPRFVQEIPGEANKTCINP